MSNVCPKTRLVVLEDAFGKLLVSLLFASVKSLITDWYLDEVVFAIELNHHGAKRLI